MKYLFCETRKIVTNTWDDHVPEDCPICNGLHKTIEIDELVYPIVDAFNKLGYHTDFSCSSHIVSGKMLKPDIEGEFYICFETIFIDDLIDYNKEMDFKDLVNQFEGKIRIFEIDIQHEYYPHDTTNLTVSDIVDVFSRINCCKTLPERIFNKVNGKELYYDWCWVIEHCFYKTNEHCGYRPHISLRCIQRDEDPATFHLCRSHYKYMSDLCSILDIFNLFVETKLQYRSFPEKRYKPELRDLEDGYYIATITDMNNIKPCAEM